MKLPLPTVTVALCLALAGCSDPPATPPPRQPTTHAVLTANRTPPKPRQITPRLAVAAPAPRAAETIPLLLPQDADGRLLLTPALPRAPAGGVLHPFGKPPVGVGKPPLVRFFGTGGRAYHVIYSSDCTGSMIESFDIVRREMLVSISRLRPWQDFNILIWRKGAPSEPGARRLSRATIDNKERAGEFMDEISPQGQTDPIPTLRRAYEVFADADAHRPGKIMFLLTDGDFPDNRAVLAEVRKLNSKDPAVRINTYLHSSYMGKYIIPAMQEIAKITGGEFKQIREDE